MLHNQLGRDYHHHHHQRFRYSSCLLMIKDDVTLSSWQRRRRLMKSGAAWSTERSSSFAGAVNNFAVHIGHLYTAILISCKRSNRKAQFVDHLAIFARAACLTHFLNVNVGLWHAVMWKNKRFGVLCVNSQHWSSTKLTYIRYIWWYIMYTLCLKKTGLLLHFQITRSLTRYQ